MFRGRRTNSHLSRETMKRTMHSAVNHPMHTASMILADRQDKEKVNKQQWLQFVLIARLSAPGQVI